MTGSFAHHPFDDNRVLKMSEKEDAITDMPFQRSCTYLSLPMPIIQASSRTDMQVMDFHGITVYRVDQSCRCKIVITPFIRQSQHHMSTNTDTAQM